MVIHLLPYNKKQLGVDPQNVLEVLSPGRARADVLEAFWGFLLGSLVKAGAF